MRAWKLESSDTALELTRPGFTVCHLPLASANALSNHGQGVDETLLQYLSPLGWEHINLTGDYVWRSSAKIGAGKFRPLRLLSTA